jgi:hypothetical protein
MNLQVDEVVAMADNNQKPSDSSKPTGAGRSADEGAVRVNDKSFDAFKPAKEVADEMVKKYSDGDFDPLD